DVIDGLDITYVTNGKRQTLKVGDTIGAVWNEIFGFFNSISGYYILKDGVTVLTQLTLGINN
ncbi:unnamed protein product, partial [Musa hybrid cultivar]